MESRVLVLEDGVRPLKKEWPKNFMKTFGALVFLGVLLVMFGLVITRNSKISNMFNSGTVSSKLRNCVEREEESRNDLRHWIRPTKSLMHAMTDEELFWRATFAPRVPKYPFKRVPKVAFMFLTRGPLPLSLIWENFFEGNDGLYSIYVHSLPSYRAAFPKTSVFYKRQIPSQVAEWGLMSMCDAEKRLLANALLDIDNERFVLLSESCIPLYNFTTTYKYLVESQLSFLGSFDDPGPYGRGRYNWNMAPEVLLSHWRKGSQWFEVSRNLALLIVEDFKYYQKFSNFCHPACYVDEHYFPTMLTIQAPKFLANRSLTWVDWSRGGAHPATFGKGDISDGFFSRIYEGHNCTYNYKITSTCYLFARKFSASTLEPLLAHLAPRIRKHG